MIADYVIVKKRIMFMEILCIGVPSLLLAFWIRTVQPTGHRKKRQDRQQRGIREVQERKVEVKDK